MSPELVSIQMRLSGGKQVAAEAETATAGIKSTETAVKRAGTAAGKAQSSWRKHGLAMRSIGRTMTFGLTLPIIGLGAMAIKTAAQFDESMNQVQIAGQIGGRGMKAMEGLALRMGAKTVFSANDAAESMLNLIKAGITPAQVRAGALAATMNLAATEGMELARTGEILGSTMNTFGIKASESSRISDALAGGANASSASVEGLAMSLAQGGQAAAMNKISMEETVGMLAAFAQNGIQASDAGTSFKTFMMRLNPTTKKASEEIRQLGLHFFNSKGQMKGVAEIAQELQDKLGGFTDKKRNRALNAIFGSDASRAASIAFREGAEGLEKYIRATREQGAAQKLANARMRGLPGAIERLKGSLETAALAFGHALAPTIRAVAGALEGLANWFTNLDPTIQQFIAGGLAIVAVLGPMIFLMGSLALALTAIGAAGLIAFAWVALVLILAAAFFILYHKVRWFHNAVDAVWDFIHSKWGMLVVPLMGIIGPILFLISHFNWLKNAAVNAFNWIKTAASNVGQFLAGWGRGVASTFAGIGRAIARPFTWVLQRIQNVISAVEHLRHIMDEVSSLGGGNSGLPGTGSPLSEGLDAIGGLFGNAVGTANFPGGLTKVGESGTELAWFPRGTRILPAGPTSRLLRGDRARPQSFSLPGASGSGTRTMQPVVVRVGRRQLAQIVAEVQEDEKARK